LLTPVSMCLALLAPGSTIGTGGAATVTVSPSSVTIPAGGDQRLTATVSGSSTTAVTWTVNNIPGGNSTVGTIGNTGRYVAPAQPPAGWTVTVKATSVANPSASAACAVTVRNQTPVLTSVSPTQLSLGNFVLTITGRGFISGAQVLWNGTALATSFVSKTQLSAGGSAAQPGTANITVANPGPSAVSSALTVSVVSAVSMPDPLAATYGRFLEQSTFGPTPALMSHVRQIGIPAFLAEQLATSESAWPTLPSATRQDAVDSFFLNAATGQDQLRQRVIFALSEIFVVAMNKNTNGDEIAPWLQLLSRNSLGNFRTLLREITLDASMGKYLDLANSAKPGVAGGANENYPREVMQLFTIGLNQLNLDGSAKLDGQGQPIPTYTQTDVRQLALALTGWTYGNASGVPPANSNWNYYPGPMLPVAANHDTTAKTVLGQSIPAGQSVTQELDSSIDILFHHPNVGPFIVTRLIRALVTSNPSPAYISRVAAAFNDNGQGVHGDMKAVITAILMDTEARNDTPPNTFGRLRSPMQHIIAMMRALNIPPGDPGIIGYLFYGMGEGLLDAPSVFGHYSPMFHIPKTALFGPEFQIYAPTEAVNRANLLYSFMANPWPINPVLQPLVSVAGNSAALVAAVDNALLYGRMSAQLRTAILNALPAMYDNNRRVMTALYLTATSGEYLVQH
jgi:uncharacterized protein (DUF1800 family)